MNLNPCSYIENLLYLFRHKILVGNASLERHEFKDAPLGKPSLKFSKLLESKEEDENDIIASSKITPASKSDIKDEEQGKILSDSSSISSESPDSLEEEHNFQQLLQQQAHSPRAIDISKKPFSFTTSKPNKFEASLFNKKRCQYDNGTLWPSATMCEDELGSEACGSIFEEQNRLSPARPSLCSNPAMNDLVRRCAKLVEFAVKRTNSTVQTVRVRSLKYLVLVV
uniref:Uncharacterized protein n=1 Tax=Ditylenchus dipsaci TaxID=166011 RepID=A0A915EDB4_9BILA